MREKIFSVTLDDCEVQTFSAGRKGGQNANRRSTGVRIIHHPSGARGESREQRSQLQNKKTAFKRMARTKIFTLWLNAVTRNLKTPKQIEKEVDDSISDSKSVRVEVKNGKKWIEVETKTLD